MSSIGDFFAKYKTILIATGVTLGVLIIGTIVMRARSSSGGEEGGESSSGGGFSKYITYAVVVVLVGAGAYFIYDSMHGDPTQSYNLLSTPLDNSKPTTVPNPSGSNVPIANWGTQFWIYVQDWGVNYGKPKNVFKRTISTGPTATPNQQTYLPNVYLHPTENTLIVEVSMLPSESGPAPANNTGGSTTDVFKCEVQNIPLQAWTAVSISCANRNLDIYLNGQLVKSCLITSMPYSLPADGGQIGFQQDGGFSGKVVDFYTSERGLTPADAMSFYNAGTSASTPVGSAKGSYEVKFGILDPSGKEIRKFVL